MFVPLSDQNRSDDVLDSSLNVSRASQNPFEASSFRMEYAREWGPCVLGIDQAMRGPLSGIGPAVFCGSVIPYHHEMQLESQGVACCFASSLSGNDQVRLSQMVQADPYIAWLLRVIPSEAADGARCSMGVLEHTTAASIIKEALALGVDVRSVRVTASCDSARFRQFLYEAFPMIEDINVLSRVCNPSATTCCSNQSMGINNGNCVNVLPSSPQSLPSSPSSPTSISSGVVIPSVVCVSGVVAQFARDNLSRHLLYRQRHSPSPLSRSPLSKPMSTSHRRERLTSSATGSFFNGPLFRTRSSSEENAHKADRCAAFAGNEFGEAHCGLVTEMPQQSQSSNIPIEMYDFCGDDDDTVMNGLTSPKRIRVVPCSPPLPSMIVSDDSPPCVGHSACIPNLSGCDNHVRRVDRFDSPPFTSTSLLVSPPPLVSSTSTSVPMYRPMFGLTSPF